MSRLSNRARLLVDGHRVLPVLLLDLANAERSIHLSMYLFRRDCVGELIADALEERARAGVGVRLLLHMQQATTRRPASAGDGAEDARGALDLAALRARMERAGVSVVDTNIDYARAPCVGDERLRSIFAQIREAIDVEDLHVDHRKIIVIDGLVAWTGGLDIGKQQLYREPFDPDRSAGDEAAAREARGLPEAWPKWHDGFTRLEGPIASAIEDAFRTRWILDGGASYVPEPPLERAPAPDAGLLVKGARVYVNEPDGRPNPIRELFVERIRSATRSIFIENPRVYHPAIVDALCEAKERTPELDVVVIVPSREHADDAFCQDAQEHCYDRYLGCGIEVREYEGRFTHLKVAVFDERWSIHGSANLSYSSLEDDKDFELVVLVDDEAFARTILEEVRDVDRRRSRQITRGDVVGPSFDALRARMGDPATILLRSQRML